MGSAIREAHAQADASRRAADAPVFYPNAFADRLVDGLLSRAALVMARRHGRLLDPATRAGVPHLFPNATFRDPEALDAGLVARQNRFRAPLPVAAGTRTNNGSGRQADHRGRETRDRNRRPDGSDTKADVDTAFRMNGCGCRGAKRHDRGKQNSPRSNPRKSGGDGVRKAAHGRVSFLAKRLCRIRNPRERFVPGKRRESTDPPAFAESAAPLALEADSAFTLRPRRRVSPRGNPPE